MSSDVSVRELIVRANRLLASGDLANARSLAQQAYKLNKNDPDVLVLVSKVITDPARQRNVLQQALEIAPTHREARQRLAALDAPTPPALPPLKPRALPLLPVLAGVFGIVALLVLVGIPLSRSHSDGSATDPTAAVALQSTVGAAPILVASTPTNNRVSVSPTALPTATLVPSVPLPSANTVGLDPLVLTTTALQQGLAATGTGLAQAVAHTTQVAGLTQTATQQGALGATVVAQQTALAAMDSLPGRLIVHGTRPENVTSPKIQFLSLSNKHPSAVLSPDVQHIAYIDQQQTLYITDADDANPQAVDLVGATSFDWSPNGQRLLVGANKGLYVVSLSDRVSTALITSNAWSTATDSTRVVWSSDNQHIAWWTEGDSDTVLVLSVLDTLKPAQVVHVMLPMTRNMDYSAPVWVPGGQRLIVRVSDGKNNRLLVIDGLSGVQEASLTISQAFDTSPFWVSPNGQWIIVNVFGAGGDKDGLYVIKSDGSGLKYLLKTPMLAKADVGWSPDGQRAFISGVLRSSVNRLGNIQWLDTTDMSLHSVLKGQQGFLAWQWAPDSQSLLVCQVPQWDDFMSRKLWLVPMATGNNPLVLLNTRFCPDYWLP